MDTPSDYSDERTGLPPLDDLEMGGTMLALRFTSSSEGIVAHPFEPGGTAVRFLHMRGLIGTNDPKAEPVWAQIHLAIPVQALESLVEMLRDE